MMFMWLCLEMAELALYYMQMCKPVGQGGKESQAHSEFRHEIEMSCQILAQTP
jgi:hypothetical protein